jgi:hypothetical protein
MAHGPGGDHFRAEWLVVALPALLAAKKARRRPSTVGIAVDGSLLQVRTTRPRRTARAVASVVVRSGFVGR